MSLAKGSLEFRLFEGRLSKMAEFWEHVKFMSLCHLKKKKKVLRKKGCSIYFYTLYINYKNRYTANFVKYLLIKN